MNFKDYAILGVVGLVCFFTFTSFSGLQVSVETLSSQVEGLATQTQKLGASSGQDHYNVETFSTLTDGRGVLAFTLTTTSPTRLLTAQEFCTNGVIELNQHGLTSITTGTINLPAAASTTQACLVPGAKRWITIRNLGTTTSTVVLENSSSTGMNLVVVGSTSTAGIPVKSANIAGSSTAVLMISQETSNTSTAVFFKGVGTF